MRINDGQGWRGEVRAMVFDGDIDSDRVLAVLDDHGAPERSRLVSDQIWTNLVTNVGRAQMTKLIVAETTLTCIQMGLSTSVIAPALADTVLPNEIIRQVLAITQSFTTYYQRYVALFSTISFGSTGIGGEGLFDTASTGGLMWADASVTISKTTTQALVVDHRIQAST